MSGAVSRQVASLVAVGSEWQWLAHATRFSFGGKELNQRVNREDWPVEVERTDQRDGSHKWAVRRLGACLDVSGEWGLDPIPASRDEEVKVMKRFRFNSKEEALECWAKSEGWL